MRSIQGKKYIWDISIKVGTILRLKAEKLMDLTDLSDTRLNDEFNKINSFYAFGAIMACVCDTEIRSRNLSFEEFFSEFEAEGINEAREKIMEGVVDFFLKSGSSQEALLLSKGLQTYQAAKSQLHTKVMEVDLMPMVMQDIEQRIEEALNVTFTK